MKIQTPEEIDAAWAQLGADLDRIQADLEAAIAEMKSAEWKAKVIAEIRAEMKAEKEARRAPTII